MGRGVTVWSKQCCLNYKNWLHIQESTFVYLSSYSIILIKSLNLGWDLFVVDVTILRTCLQCKLQYHAMIARLAWLPEAIQIC